MDNLRVTKHARRRFKERVKLPHRATERMALLALERGLDEDDPSLSPPLRAKMRRARQNHDMPPGQHGVYCMYQGILYIFASNGALLTVLPGFDDPDQRGMEWRQEGTHWKGGERAQYLRNRRPRKDEEPDHE